VTDAMYLPEVTVQNSNTGHNGSTAETNEQQDEMFNDIVGNTIFGADHVIERDFYTDPTGLISIKQRLRQNEHQLNTDTTHLWPQYQNVY